MLYTIKKTYKFSEIVEVEANSKQEALELSNGIDSDDGPEYECLYDAVIIKTE